MRKKLQAAFEAQAELEKEKLDAEREAAQKVFQRARIDA